MVSSTDTETENPVET